MAEKFNRYSSKLTTTNATTVYTAPSANANDRAIVLSLLVANVTGSAAAITVDITDNAGTQLSRLTNALSLPANASLEVIVNKQVLNNGDKISCTSGTASAHHVTVSALEITV